MRILALLTIVSVLCVVRPARAQPLSTPAPELKAQQAPPGSTRSEAFATVLALGSTIAGVAVLDVGVRHNSTELNVLAFGLLTIGPSAGHIYSGEIGHSTLMTALRAVSIVAFGGGLISGMCEESCGSEGAAMVMFYGGAVTYGIATFYDLVDAYASARRYNQRQRRAVAITPAIVQSAGDGKAPAILVSGSF